MIRYDEREDALPGDIREFGRPAGDNVRLGHDRSVRIITDRTLASFVVGGDCAQQYPLPLTKGMDIKDEKRINPLRKRA